MGMKERSRWVVCPECGSDDAAIEMYSNCSLFICPDCDEALVEDVPPEPVSI